MPCRHAEQSFVRTVGCHHTLQKHAGKCNPAFNLFRLVWGAAAATLQLPLGPLYTSNGRVHMCCLCLHNITRCHTQEPRRPRLVWL